jgi:DNA polymerase III delta prime subunit
VIDYLGANSKENVRFIINAPSYFASGKYLLEITFTGTIEGNTSTKFTEVKYVTLTILEMKRSLADEYVNSSLDLISKMNSSGLVLNEVQSILDSMNSNYENLNFMTLKEEADKIEEIYTAATDYTKLRDEINQLMIESEKNGVATTETKKLFLLSEILFKRGDYIAAYEKMKEAKSSYLLETKGEFKLLYAIKNNPVETLTILISISILGIGSGYFIRLKLLKIKLRMLSEEEVLLLQLMRVVQRDCFENNKMSMEEYSEAMYQYEGRLSSIIQERVTTETLITNLMKLGGKKKALMQEKDRLYILLKQTQEDYMNRGKLDTRVYENMLKTYSSRLSKVDEELVFIEAQEQIRKVTSFWRNLFKK